jgi:ribosome modulation factor
MSKGTAMDDLWDKCDLSIAELNEIQQEGYSAYLPDSDEQLCNPYPENTLEHEFFSDGWEDAHDDENNI